MAPKYKLIYFNLRGIGETIRWLLSYMEADFEDSRFEIADWPTVKPTTPFGKAPVLEVDGVPLTQSISIYRYLGRQAGLGGDDPWEDVQIDIIADTINDFRVALSAFMWEANEDIKKEKKEIFIKETLPFYLGKLEAIVKENGGYLANGKLSWVDFFFASITELLSYAVDVADITADYPALNALKTKIFNIPQIKNWVEKRPDNPF